MSAVLRLLPVMIVAGGFSWAIAIAVAGGWTPGQSAAVAFTGVLAAYSVAMVVRS